MSVFCLALLMLASLVAVSFADGTNAAGKDQRYFMTLQIQPLPVLLFPTISIYNLNATIEFALGSGNIGASIGSTFASGSASSSNTNSLINISGSIFDADVFYRIVPFVNPDKGPLDGFYIGPGVRYELDSANASSSGASASASFTRVGPFVDVGYQWVNNHFAIDLNIGGGYFLYNSVSDASVTFTSTSNYYFRFMFELGFGL